MVSQTVSYILADGDTRSVNVSWAGSGSEVNWDNYPSWLPLYSSAVRWIPQPVNLTDFTTHVQLDESIITDCISDYYYYYT